MLLYLIEDEDSGYQTGLAETPEGKQVSRLMYVHSVTACEDHHCYIHNTASLHPLSMEPVVWNDQYQTMERVCAHQQLHPDKDNVDYFLQNGGFPYVHTPCDGCCTNEGYKG